MPEEPAEEKVASHKRCRFESPGQPPPEVDQPLAECVEQRTVKQCAGNLRQYGPVAVEADKEGDASPDLFASLTSADRTGVM
jgi:hypothetical protein